MSNVVTIQVGLGKMYAQKTVAVSYLMKGDFVAFVGEERYVETAISGVKEELKRRNGGTVEETETSKTIRMIPLGKE